MKEGSREGLAFVFAGFNMRDSTQALSAEASQKVSLQPFGNTIPYYSGLISLLLESKSLYRS